MKIDHEGGPTAIEYGLIASLITVAIIGVLVTFGPRIQQVFDFIKANPN